MFIPCSRLRHAFFASHQSHPQGNAANTHQTANSIRCRGGDERGHDYHGYGD